MITDIVIVGKGIAALVLSFLLNQKGIKHVILDRKNSAKHFDLAETIPPSALPLLQSIGLLSFFEANCQIKTNGYHSCWGSDRLVDNNFYFHHPFKYGLKLNKKRILLQLDQLISSQTILFEQLLNLTNEKIGHAITYSENGIEKTIHAKYIIDATGRNRALLKILNISTVDYDKTLSFSCHLPKKTHPKIKHNVFVESFREGWGLVSRLDENQNIISIFTNSQSSIFNAVKEYSNWPAILQETQYLKHFLSSQEKVKIRGGQSNSSKPAHSAGEHWMAIGDAALAFDPLCSHGITNAIYTAKSAAEALAGALKNEDQGKNLFAAYDQSMGDIFQAYLRSRQGLYTSEKRWPDSSFWQAQIGHTLAAV